MMGLCPRKIWQSSYHPFARSVVEFRPLFWGKISKIAITQPRIARLRWILAGWCIVGLRRSCNGQNPLPVKFGEAARRADSRWALPRIYSWTWFASSHAIAECSSNQLITTDTIIATYFVTFGKRQNLYHIRLITKTGRREHITTILRELHWLPVWQCIDFNLAVLVYKALHGQLPQYLAEDCQLLTDIGRRSLRSANVLTCGTRRTRTRLGDRSFFRRWTVSLELSACYITW